MCLSEMRLLFEEIKTTLYYVFELKTNKEFLDDYENTIAQ